MKKIIGMGLILWGLSIGQAHAVGDNVVTDPWSYGYYTTQITVAENSLQQNLLMVKSLGNGGFVPVGLNYLSNQLNKCGFTSLTFPSLTMPPLPQICGNEQAAFNASLSWYSTDVLPIVGDSPETVLTKNKTRQKLISQTRANAAALADTVILNKTKPEVVKNLDDGIGQCVSGDGGQICIAKVAATAQIRILQELQEQTRLQAFKLKMDSLQ